DGGFKKFDAKANADFEAPENSSLNVEIDTNSLWSDNPKLTNHLKNPDFFDVRKYPKITFESTKLVPGKEGKGSIIGKLTMLGETKEIKIPVKSEVTDEQIIVDADFMLDRTKWGMNYGQGKVNNEVSVKAHLVFKR
ncbi:MAG: YceI family protein, partial [Pirellulaceae bacterium]